MNETGPLALLRQIYDTRQVEDVDGTVYQLGDTPINRRFARILYQTVRHERPSLVIEVGMAYGLSTLAILAGLHENAAGILISIDPSQTSHYNNIGVKNVERVGMADRHRCFEAADFDALPVLLKEHERACGLVYIDGRHNFDYTTLDLFYADRLVKIGGIVALNDGWMIGVHKAIRMFLQQRHYEAVDVGLPRHVPGRNSIARAAKRVFGFNGADQYYRKLDDWEPEWHVSPRTLGWLLR